MQMYNEDNGLDSEAAPVERVFDPPSQKEAMYQKQAEKMEPLNFDDAREVCCDDLLLFFEIDRVEMK